MQYICYLYATILAREDMASIYQKKGSDIWYYHICIEGKHYQGSCRTKDKKDAEKIANALQTDVARARAGLKSLIKKSLPFEDIFYEYLKNLNTSKKTIEVRDNAAKHFLLFFRDRDISDINIEHIKTYQLQRKLEVLSSPKNVGKREQEISFRTINIETETLYNFFNFCIDRGYLEKNPASEIKKLNELSRLKTLSDSDIQKLIAGATNKLTKDLISFLVFTGCRKGEALNLKWDDIDLQNGVIAIKGTKTKYDRYIPISDALRSILDGIERVYDSLYVFERNGAKLGNFKRSFKTACKNAGLKDLHIHDLRHVFASKLVMNGTSLYKTGILLGHRTPSMTQRYAHLKPGELKREIDKSFGGDIDDIKWKEYERALEIINEYEKKKDSTLRLKKRHFD
jgi:integrase